jgi:hypothetical protein|tara:strand:+ start:743 stop:1219 length:477 start_codon:yes stop_codon:yes gene_type:complete
MEMLLHIVNIEEGSSPIEIPLTDEPIYIGRISEGDEMRFVKGKQDISSRLGFPDLSISRDHGELRYNGATKTLEYIDHESKNGAVLTERVDMGMIRRRVGKRWNSQGKFINPDDPSITDRGPCLKASISLGEELGLGKYGGHYGEHYALTLGMRVTGS